MAVLCLVAWLGAGSGLSCATVAEAQAAVHGAEQRAARAFRSAEAAYRAGRYEQALASFEEAYTMAPHDAVHFNIAVCLEQLGRLVEAVARYDLVIASTEIDRASIDLAREARERVVAQLGRIRVVGPSEAVSIEDRVCSVPCETFVTPGRIEVVREREGSRYVEVAAGATATLDLSPPRTSTPEDDPPETPRRRHSTSPVDDEASTEIAPTFWIAGGLAVVTAGIAIGLGVHVVSLGDAYVQMPSLELQSEGNTLRDTTNVLWVVAGVSAVVALLDVLVFEPPGRPITRASSRRDPPLTVRF